MSQPQPNPFAEIESRHVSEWRGFLTDNPDMLSQGTTVPAGRQEPSARAMVRGWDEIPDVLALASQKIDWLVDRIIPRASIILIAGEPGSYKSWLALCLLRAAACGKNFLGRGCSPLDVLYLDRENPLPVVRERLAILGIESLAQARIWGGWLRDAPPSIGDFRLRQIAHDRKPLLVFDSLIRFHQAEENSASEIAPVMQELRALANDGATVLVLHHRAKNESSRYRGSSDIAGGVDVALSLSRDREAGIVKLQCFKSRFSEEFSMTLRPELHETGDFAVADSQEAGPPPDIADSLVEAICSQPGQTQTELLASTGLPQSKARILLVDFDGKLWRSERGDRNAKRYFPLDNSGPIEGEQ